MTPRQYGEDALVEQPALTVLAELGWTVVDAFEETYGSAGTLGRDSMGDVFLVHRLADSVAALNPKVPAEVRSEAVDELVRGRSNMDRVKANQAVHDLVRNGYAAQWQERGEQKYASVQFVDFRHWDANDWVAASQVWVAGELHRRRADTVLYVNGIPLVLAEFKEPNRPVSAAYEENLTDYRDTIPDLFIPNAFVLLSNGREALVGATFAPLDFFSEWTAIDRDGTTGLIQLDTALRGVCAPDRLLDLVENFVAYLDKPGGTIKALAKHHQMHGVNDAIENLYKVRSAGEKKLGVFWHTQGSGKTLSMYWFTQKVLRHIPGKWTFVMVTDRTELDEQLHGEFVDAGAVPQQARVHADSAAHLRELLDADHRYVFTLIHKFRLNDDETQMPVLTERNDVIVITDEAHRSQYDTLALNMRQALPNAAFMGFTGTPLMGDEELTREQFGDYVSIYNFQDAIRDGATLPLYYENRIPELQIVNENFDKELTELLEAAELDESAEAQLSVRFGREYALLTRPERLKAIAKDLVNHFVGRGFPGKAMYVGMDKAAAVRMYDLVQEAWAEHLADLRTQHDSLPEVERPWLASRISLMESTDMAVVVSQGQNEIKILDDAGLDIRPHRARMNSEDLAEKFKDPDDPLRIVFVCAMWMTGFDAPSVSTIYLDRYMQNHSLMQTIARANRVFPEKNNGLIVDYVGVFRHLEAALAIYGAAEDDDGKTPIRSLDMLAKALADSVAELLEFCATVNVDLPELRDARGFEYVAMADSAVELLLGSEETTTEFLTLASHVRKLFKALLPDERAAEHRMTVAAARNLAERIVALHRPDKTDISDLADAVDQLLDRSVGAEEYVIRGAAERGESLIDLTQIDFDQLAKDFAGRKRTAAERLASLLRRRVVTAAGRNPTRYDLVERIDKLIADYNADAINTDEYLRRLIDLTQTLTEEEQRAVTEGMTEEELAIFDLLTKPEPVLTDEEREVVKTSAKALLAHIHEQLVLDWRRKADATAAVKVGLIDVLDRTLPADPYPKEVFDEKVGAIYDHVLSSYGDEGASVYAISPATMTITDGDLGALADDVTDRLRADPEFAAYLAGQLNLPGGTVFRSTSELIENDEDYAVEFKSTARYDLATKDKSAEIETAIVKTVAAFLNTDGGTLLIGIGPDRELVGLGFDYPHVKPANADGLVNWLTTKLISAVGHTPATKVRIRIEDYRGTDICRVDVAPSRTPVWAKTSKKDAAFFVRFNNSTRDVSSESQEAVEAYIADHW
jgi:type I restriction enzyme R subunit